MNSLGKGSQSPLRLSSINGHFSIAQILLDHGADVNLKHEDGLSALNCARASPYKEIVQPLLERGADPDDTAVDDATPTDITQ